ncbi:MAG: hypothetical protein ACRDOA_02235 [Streptosporangiaceae bacterium]
MGAGPRGGPGPAAGRAWGRGWHQLGGAGLVDTFALLVPVAVPAGLALGGLAWAWRIYALTAGVGGWTASAPIIFDTRQWKRQVRTAKGLNKAPGAVPLLARGGRIPVGGTIRTIEHHWRPVFSLPAEACGRHMVVVGATGSGKTNLMIRLWVLYQMIDTGTGAAAYYADILQAVVDLAVLAPCGPPANTASFLDRLAAKWLQHAWGDGRYPAELARARAAARHLPDIQLRYATLLGRLGPALDGPGSLAEADVWYCVLEGTREPSVAQAQAMALTGRAWAAMTTNGTGSRPPPTGACSSCARPTPSR